MGLFTKKKDNKAGAEEVLCRGDKVRITDGIRTAMLLPGAIDGNVKKVIQKHMGQEAEIESVELSTVSAQGSVAPVTYCKIKWPDGAWVEGIPQEIPILKIKVLEKVQ